MRAFLQAGHLPTLIAALLHFETSFMVWVLMGGLGVLIAHDLGLSPAAKGLVVGIPLLGGALSRVPIGLLGDRYGPKRVGTASLVAVAVPLVLAWQVASSVPGLLAVGLALGLAGSSFAVALPLAARAYPPRYQGTAMGIVAAGNSGAVLATLVAPQLGEAIGWRGVFGLAAVPVLLVAGLFVLFSRESPREVDDSARQRTVRGLMGEPDLWWFSLLYTMTFGGYVGLSVFLAIYFHDQYAVGAAAAGALVAVCALAGSVARPVGGAIADRVGGVRVLAAVYAAVPLFLVAPVLGAPLPLTLAALMLAMAGLGLGNGAVFQLVPKRFGRNVGLATGVTGAAGGLGGFLLPAMMGIERELTGSYGPGFVIYAVSLAYMFLCLQALQSGWRFTWLSPGSTSRTVPEVDA